MNRLITFLLLCALLISCTPAVQPPAPSPVPVTAAPSPTAEPQLPWQRRAVFYEIFVRSFNDSNGDGIGDFNGITQKLDYLQSLGVTAIWLMPIHPSPTYHGYDVLNYYAVNPQYGTLDDFKHLLSAAHEKGIRIIIDLVLNHTSSRNPWFAAAASVPQSTYHDYYVWSAKGSGARWYQAGGQYYYAYFDSSMPDLNYRNPEVTKQMEKISAFWLDTVGVDGFRVDAAKHLIEEGSKLENTPATHAWLKDYTAWYKALKPEAYVVGEVASAGGFIAKTYAGQMDQVFNFELANAFVSSAGGEGNSSVVSGFKFLLKDKPDGNFATFLTNHDQNRVMSVLHGSDGKSKTAASLLFTSPGTPFIYYGEELGMQGQKPDEDIRLPMQWTADPLTAGFSTGIPWRAPFAKIGYANAAAQIIDPASLFNHYKSLIALRKDHSALQTGELVLLDASAPGLVSYMRTDTTETLLVLINLTGKSVSAYQLSLLASSIADGSNTPQVIFGAAIAIQPLTVQDGKFKAYQPAVELPPYSTLVLKLSK